MIEKENTNGLMMPSQWTQKATPMLPSEAMNEQAGYSPLT